MRVFRFFFLLFSLLLAHELSAQDTTCAIIWDEPILLSDTNYNAHSPKIALSGDDTIHITWENGGQSKPRLPLVQSFDGGLTLLPARELVADTIQFPGQATWIELTTQSQNVFIFFRTPVGGESPVRMLESSDGGISWDSLRTISPNLAGEIRSSSVIGETLAVVYAVVPPGIKRVLRSVNMGQSWTQSAGGLDYFARTALSPGGILHLAQMGSNETEYRRSHDLGDTWSQQVLLSPPDGLQSSDPIIAAGTIAGDSTIIAAWRDAKYGCIGLVGCSVIGRRGVSGPDSSAYDAERVLTSIPAGYEPSLSVHNGDVAAAWPMDRTAPPFVQVRVSRDSMWCPSFDPTTGLSTHYTDRTDVALSTKAVHVVWSASQAPDPSTFRIFYRRGRFITADVRELDGMPRVTFLKQNYPNPFNPTTVISYELDVKSEVQLVVYDMLGRELATLVNERKDPGRYSVDWNAQGVSSGVYYYRLVVGGRVETKKAVLIK